MRSFVRLFLVSAAVLSAAACGEMSTANNRTQSLPNAQLAQAFATVPVGYSTTQTSYDNTAEGAGPMFPHGEMVGLGRGPGAGLGGGMGPMIGGGLGGDFLGGRGLGHDFGRGRFGDPALGNGNCAFSAATGRVSCDPVTERGLTVIRSTAYTDASGAAESAFDSIRTNTINTRVSVSGTITRRDSATTTINNASDRTVSGLAKGSTAHTVNGTAAGSELTSGKDSTGTFTALRTAADTIRGVVVPVVDTGRTYPRTGMVIRVMQVSVTRAGSAAATSSRREVITYDGSATARLVITQDGTTKTCTLPLPFGRPTCP